MHDSLITMDELKTVHYRFMRQIPFDQAINNPLFKLQLEIMAKWQRMQPSPKTDVRRLQANDDDD